MSPPLPCTTNFTRIYGLFSNLHQRLHYQQLKNNELFIHWVTTIGPCMMLLVLPLYLFPNYMNVKASPA
jgi:hypothetical protein